MRQFPTFGFQGVFHLPRVYRNMREFLVQNVTERLLRSDIQFSLFANAMRTVSEPYFQALLRRRKSLDEKSEAALLNTVGLRRIMIGSRQTVPV